MRKWAVVTAGAVSFFCASFLQANACSNVVASFLDPVVGVDAEGAADIHLTSGAALDVTSMLKISSASAVWYEPIDSINNLVNFQAFDIWVDSSKHVQMQASRASTRPGALAVLKIRIFLCDPVFT